MNVRYRIELSQAERDELTAMLSKGKRAACKLKRAQILLAADAGCGDEEIARAVAVGGSTVYRTKRRFVEGNLERALSKDPRPGAERKLTGKEEALLVATACANPPEGRARWTLELLADAMVKLTGHESLSGHLHPGCAGQPVDPLGRLSLRGIPTRRSPANLEPYEFHYTPKHASWLNMVEIEIGVLRGQCLDRRIDNPNRLIGEIAAWEKQRNDAGARMKWMFTTEKARAKMGRAYPVTSKES
jgi:transposase